MSGHSKWKTIKHQKGAADAKRSQVFTKLTRELMMAARLGSADPATNSRLRLAVEKARKEGADPTACDLLEQAIYPGGVGREPEGGAET